MFLCYFEKQTICSSQLNITEKRPRVEPEWSVQGRQTTTSPAEPNNRGGSRKISARL
jgi:hypothetical protein